jgi:hypothetical protein
MADDDIERSELEAEAEVLPKRLLMSILSPDASAGGLPVPDVDGFDSDPGAEQAPDEGGATSSDEESTQSDSANGAS